MSRADPIVTPRRSLPHRSSSTESEILGRSRSTSSNRSDKSSVTVSRPGRKIQRMQDRSCLTPTRSPVESDCDMVEGVGQGDSEAMEENYFTVVIDENGVIENGEVVEEVEEIEVPKVTRTKTSSGTLKLRKSSVKTLKEDNMSETANFEVKIHLENGNYKCKMCKFECLEIEAIYARKHARMLKCPSLKKKCKASIKVYSCEECEITCIGKLNLNKHRRTEHKIKKHRCSICHKEYSSRKCYRQHLKDHQLMFSCDHCPKKFPRRSQLVIHVCNVHPTSESSSNDINSNNGWKNQVKAALESGDVKSIEDTFKLCTRTCSTSNKLWISYLEWRKSNLTDGNKEEVDSLKKLVEEALEEDLDSRGKVSVFAAKLAEECGDVIEARRILDELRKWAEGKQSANEISEVLVETSKFEARAENYKTAYGLMESVVKMKYKSSSYEAKKYTCPLCSQELSSTRNLDRHIVLVHSVVECDVCGEMCQDRKTFNNHSKSCVQMCGIIGCSFKSVYKWRINKHMRQKHKT